jgi:hypothetical protein
MDSMIGPRKLGTLFDECVFRVPPYQRAYTWSPSPHLENFIGDLLNHPNDPEKSYFYGTILLSRTKDIERRHLTVYDVVDGQQRLTTACIFVAAALPRLLKDPELSPIAEIYQEKFICDRLGRRKFVTVTSDDGFFERIILQNDERRDAPFETPSQRRLFNAKQYFAQAISDMSVGEIAKLIAVLYESQILVYAVNSDVEATQIFELQNDRGIPLTSLDALKSFLMYGLYLHAGQSIATDLPIVQQDFSAIYQSAEKMEGLYDKRSEDQLLVDHCIAFEERRTINDSDGWYQPKQLVRQLLEEIPAEKKSAWIKSFSNRLRNSFECAWHIMDARDRELSIPLGELTALGRTAGFWPLLLKCWKLDMKPGRPDFDRVVRKMESYAFRSTLGGKRADKGIAALRVRANAFLGNFEKLTSVLDNMRNDAGILEHFSSNLNSEHFFEWWGDKGTYLLWRYENDLRTRTGRGMPRLSWQTLVSPTNTKVKFARDHIEPKNPKNPNLTLPVKWNRADKESRPFGDVCLHRLGNLVLDTVSAGAARGDGDFESRIPLYRGSGLLSQGEVVDHYAKTDSAGKLVWNMEAIRERQEDLVTFAMNQL